MLRVLVIDDDSSLRTLFATALAKAGYSVTSVASANEALRLFYRDPADLVLVDITVPEVEGIRVVSSIRRDFPTAGVVAISDHSSNAAIYATMARELGAHRILPKPFTMGELLAAVKETEAAVILPLRSE
jgi:DNA-binding response OmpR family regulator